MWRARPSAASRSRRVWLEAAQWACAVVRPHCLLARLRHQATHTAEHRFHSLADPQVHELASQLQQQHGLPNMRCNYTNKKARGCALRSCFVLGAGPTMVAAQPTSQPPSAPDQGFYFVLGAASGGGTGRGGRGGRGGGRQKHPREFEEDGEEEYSQLPQQSAQPTASTAGGAASSAWGTAAGRGGRGGTAGRGGGSQQLRIPPGFSVLQHNGRTAHVTTCELNALNARLRDASNDCLVLTEQVGGDGVDRRRL